MSNQQRATRATPLDAATRSRLLDLVAKIGDIKAAGILDISRHTLARARLGEALSPPMVTHIGANLARAEDEVARGTINNNGGQS